jgi:hypothetical protein
MALPEALKNIKPMYPHLDSISDGPLIPMPVDDHTERQIPGDEPTVPFDFEENKAWARELTRLASAT